ncbi:alanine--glyoxylate aminotransferase family protein [bacterium]|nr:alanine--glyoxylate aminotransferase family protein [bacterium]
MQTYPIPLVPGPTSVLPAVLAAYQTNYGSGDMEPEFVELYQHTQQQLQRVIQTQNDIHIMTGEGMLALWGALKSCLLPGDKILAVATGIFGYGIGELAKSIGAEVSFVDFEFDEIVDPQKVETAIRELKPKMVTMVHCETPSGTLNPVADVGRLIKKYDVPLFYVDTVASAGGTPVNADDWQIDLCLMGTQKAFSSPPDLAMLSVSPKAWEMIETVNYQGYDALKPFQEAVATAYFPYTPAWHSVAALNTALKLLLDQGMENVFAAHDQARKYTIDRIQKMGLEIFAKDINSVSPTVTPVKIPPQISWDKLNQKLRAEGVVVGGSWGKLAGNVFRIGHMGTQTNMEKLIRGLDILEKVL